MAQQLSFAYDTPTEKVLSLCIPTYNRAHCLKEQFQHCTRRQGTNGNHRFGQLLH